MFCTSCGKEFGNDMNFCPYCGTPAMRSEQSSQNYDNGQNYYQNPYGYGQTYGNGQPYGNQAPYGYNAPDPNDVPSAGFNALAFFFPVVGLILYLVWRDSTPKKAKAIGKWALISVIVGVVLYILMIIGMTAMFTFTGMSSDAFIM